MPIPATGCSRALPSAPFTANIPGMCCGSLRRHSRERLVPGPSLANSADTAIGRITSSRVFYFTVIHLYRYNDSSRQVEALPELLPHIPDSIGYSQIILAPHSSAVYYVARNLSHLGQRHRCAPRPDYALGVFFQNARLPLNNVNMYTYIIVGISS